MKADTPLEILTFLDRHAQRVEFETLAPVFRDKRRVLLHYRDPSTGVVEVVRRSQPRSCCFHSLPAFEMNRRPYTASRKAAQGASTQVWR
jgi:hypothetical protein